MDENKRIVEVNGVKIEVDMRYARRIDEFKVGDTVKVLDKRNGSNKMLNGVITDFAMFKELPTIMVAVYVAGSYFSAPTIEFIPYNNDTKDIEIVGVSEEELFVSKDTIVQRFEDEISKKRNELNDLMQKRNLFINYFGKKREVEEE